MGRIFVWGLAGVCWNMPGRKPPVKGRVRLRGYLQDRVRLNKPVSYIL